MIILFDEEFFVNQMLCSAFIDFLDNTAGSVFAYVVVAVILSLYRMLVKS